MVESKVDNQGDLLYHPSNQSVPFLVVSFPAALLVWLKNLLLPGVVYIEAAFFFESST